MSLLPLLPLLLVNSSSFPVPEGSMEARTALHAAVQSYQQQQEQGGSRLPTVVAKSKLLQDLVWHGTTTCAFVFDHGILVAVDSRASMGKLIIFITCTKVIWSPISRLRFSLSHPTQGSYIGSSATEKVLPVSPHILATMAGGAADCAFWIRHLAMQVGGEPTRTNPFHS
jgi:hypothetical protein